MGGRQAGACAWGEWAGRERCRVGGAWWAAVGAGRWLKKGGREQPVK